MDGSQFDNLFRTLGQSRRSLVGGALVMLTGVLAGAGTDAKKKKRKKKHKKKRHKGKDEPTCGKAGDQPVSGKCCAGSVLVDGVCRRCDVCANGCQFSAIQAAIDAAAPGATIAICPGTYGGRLSIAKDVRLFGAGDGNGAGDTIVQGSGNGSVVGITKNGAAVDIRQVRITGGAASSGSGGGMENQGGTVSLTDCTVTGNTARAAGGIKNLVGTLTLTRCAITANTTAEAAGGIFNTGSLTLRDSTISENTVIGAGKGGGIYNAPTGTIEADADSGITGNSAGDSGGGIYNDNGTVTLASSAIVSSNTPNNCAGAAVANCNG